MKQVEITKFRKAVYKYYKKHGRHSLPWRKTTNPYRILVSELMLQQTQVVRVVPKYKAFIKKFPTIQTLHKSSLKEILITWQGLGYNRRAKYLHDLAHTVVEDFNGVLPKDAESLQTLSGVGEYTASAVCVFAYNKPQIMLETNIRTVLFYHFLTGKKNVHDKELMEIASMVLDTKNPREWYWALMDYGAYLKEQRVRTNSTSVHYKKQSTFKGSDREIRGAILRTLTEHETQTTQELTKIIQTKKEKISTQLTALHKEGLIKNRGVRWYL